jgi:hypothetical protein
MLATGKIDPIARNFDITGVNETQTSITIINNRLRLSYISEAGELVQLVKDLNQTDDIVVADLLGVSPAREGGLGGYAQRSLGVGVAKSLTNVSWNDTSNVTSKSFVDDSGHTRTAVLLPITLH